MVVQGHPGALLDEEEHEAVVFGIETVDRHTIKVALKVVRAIAAALDTHAFGRHGVHSLHHVLTGRVGNRAIEEGAMAWAMLGLQA